MSTLLSFHQVFGENPNKTYESKLIVTLDLLGFEYQNLGLSSLEYSIKLKNIRLKWRTSSKPISYIFNVELQKKIELQTEIAYEIFIYYDTSISNEFITSEFILQSILDTIEGKQEHKLNYYSSFDEKMYYSDLKIGKYSPIIFYNKENILDDNSLALFRSNYQALKDKLNKDLLDIAKLKFNDIFEKQFSKEESSLLIELISLKTRTEELFDSMKNNMEFSIELLELMKETKENKFNIQYKKYPFLYILLSPKIGFIYSLDKDIEQNINTLKEIGLEILN